MKQYSLPSKSSLYFLLTLLLSLSGCNKSEVGPTGMETLLVGRWQLQQTSGGFGGGTQPADPNRKQELVFTSNGRAQFLVNGAVEIPAGYTIRREFLAVTNRQEDIIDFGAPLSSYRATLIIVELTASSLVLADPYVDGFIYHYGRP